MLHRAIVFGVCAAILAAAADLPWKTVGACLTPQGTLCRTIKWKSTGWANVSWGFHAIRRWSGSAVLAYTGTGSSVERYTQQTYRNRKLAELRHLTVCRHVAGVAGERRQTVRP